MTASRASARAAKRRTTFRRTTTPADPRNRLIGLLALFVIVGAGMVAVLVDLQTVRSDEYRSYGEEQRTRTRAIAGYRGAVVDRNGYVLAASTPSHQIVADPTRVKDPAITGTHLAPILGIDAAVLADELEATSASDRYRLLARNIDDETVARIQQLRTVEDGGDALDGIFVRPEEDRVYPGGELAAPIIGTVDPDEQGVSGVELQYNEVMTGIAGREQFERGRFGSISVGEWKVDPATAGYDVSLTIDSRVQYVAEQTLIEHCDTTGAEGATAIVGDPASGEILAMASVKRFEDGCGIAGYNAALLDTFEPGSVMKSIVVAAATEELGYSADTTVDVPNRVVVGGKGFNDHPPHPTAPYPISQILAQSMNVGTILLAQELNAETVYHYFDAFGVGRPTGLDFKDEASGSLRHPDEWWGSDHGSIPIGQGLTVNATQLLTVYNVIANGGTFVEPTLVSSMAAADGIIHSAAVPESRTVISQRTADEVTRSLIAVVEDGTGSNAVIPGIAVGGKTGTAWKVFDDGSGKLGYGADGNRRYVVSFAGFFPADDPQISMVVVVDEPDGDATASAIAAPIFSEIGDYTARLYDIVPAPTSAPTEGPVRAAPAGAVPGSDDDIATLPATGDAVTR